MKKTLLTLALTAVCVGAFAQGKINMQNQTLRAVYFEDTLAADAALVNTRAAGGVLPSGITLMVDLFGGPNAGSMTLQQSTTIIPGTPGTFSRNFISPNLPGGVVATFQVKVRDGAFATMEASQAGGSYFGFSQIFTMVPGAGIAYPSLWASPSTWAAGTVPLDGATMGAIPLQLIPEPSSMVLAGLGAASLLIFRRRN